MHYRKLDHISHESLVIEHGAVSGVSGMSLRHLVDALIYVSVALGIILLLQLRILVPAWLFYSVLVGWVCYLVVAAAVATGHKVAYPIAMVLALVTLFVSLPQPEHYSYVEAGFSLASATFLTGSVLQIVLLVTLSIYLIRERRRH